MNIYIVEVDGNTHYVRSPSKFSAVRHIIDNHTSCRMASHDDLMKAFHGGVHIEGQEAPESDTQDLPFTMPSGK
jgi:hypothetical protein